MNDFSVNMKQNELVHAMKWNGILNMSLFKKKLFLGSIDGETYVRHRKCMTVFVVCPYGKILLRLILNQEETF